MRKFIGRHSAVTKCVALLLAVVMMAVCAGCDHLSGAAVLAEAAEIKGKQDVPQDFEEFAKGYLPYAFELLRQVRGTTDGTTVLSPFSMMYAVGMAENGAGSETLAEFEKLFGMKREVMNEFLSEMIAWSESEDYLTVSNSVWIQENFAENVRKEFLDICAKKYYASVLKAPFDESTIRDVNNWISDHTDKMIQNMLDRLDAGAVMLLVNAILFDQKWEKPFEKKETLKNEPFNDKDGNKLRTENLMVGTEQGSYYRDELCTVVDKYYEDGWFSMRILVPEKGVSVDELLTALTPEYWNKIDFYENRKNAKITLMLPSFTEETRCEEIIPVLQKMGLNLPFVPSADFSGITDPSCLYISRIIHQAKIEVSEEGTRAAAATVVEMSKSMAPVESEHITVRADHPFVYAIDFCGIPIFLGTFE